ncbi:hypothetical protein E2C01_001144 [Portunus trituberculatus]|uniref:Uncharacterized protein n=1 Tax=Portunus trituberculatus TaxID=210409 RepID=A0A5B7CJP5_PORTR|nr:hypothetical protein [Portunus trituberculatus]
MRSSHLGPVALIDQPKFRKKPAPSPMPTTMRTSIPAGPEYIEKLFSSLNQKVERSLAGLTQNNHSTYPHGTNTSEAAGTASLNQPVRGIDYQDPRDPHTKPKSLPPKLYQLFQVVFVIEQRLTPHYPRSLHNALLRAIQAIVSKPDFKITPQTLASLTTWYIASTSIDGQAKKGQKWRRARTFLMDLLFHHPNTVHLALLTGATASRGVFCKNIKNRGETADCSKSPKVQNPKRWKA